MKSKLFFAILLFHFFSTCAISHANDYLTNIPQSYDNDGSIKSIGFGDIKTKSTPQKSESDYFVVKEYENDEYDKTSEGYEKIWFYSTIQKNRSRETPAISMAGQISHHFARKERDVGDIGFKL
jgi:hypothetical protein